VATAACGGNGGDNGDGGTGGTGGNTSTVTGVVYSWEESDVPITVAGVSVGVFGAQISDTSDANGRFILQDVPNGEIFFTPAKTEYWGLVDYYSVPLQTGGRDIRLSVVPDGEIARWGSVLMRSIPETQGAVDIIYYGGPPNGGPQGGETGGLSASSDDEFTFDVWTPVDQTSVIAETLLDGSGFGELVFTSIDPANETITATVTGAPGATQCVVDETPGIEYPIIAKSLTIVYAYCEPL
jgi:hypothetical protein